MWLIFILTELQHPTTKKTTVQLLTPEDATLQNDELSQEARWSYYVSTYTMRDPTEGVPFSQMRLPFMKRSLPGKLGQEDEYNRYYRPLVHHDGLIIRICANSYHLLYEPGSSEWSWRPTGPSEEDAEEAAKDEAAVKERRRDRFMEKFVNNPVWAHGLSKDQVDESNQRFRSWINGTTESDGGPGPDSGPGTEAEAGAGAETEGQTGERAAGEGDGEEAGTTGQAPPPEETSENKPVEPEDAEMADAEPAAASESKEP